MKIQIQRVPYEVMPAINTVSCCVEACMPSSKIKQQGMKYNAPKVFCIAINQTGWMLEANLFNTNP